MVETSAAPAPKELTVQQTSLLLRVSALSVLGAQGLCQVPQALAFLLYPSVAKIAPGKGKDATLLPEAETQRGGSETPGVPDVSGEGKRVS